MKRNKHNLSHYRLSTMKLGGLYPVSMVEALPGDSIQQATSVLLRASPLLAPVMHPVTVRVHHWFVPYRLLWDGWESFITGGKDGQGDGVGTIPTYQSALPVPVGGLADHFGITPGLTSTAVSRFPFDAYELIVKEWYADQDFWDASVIPVDRLTWGIPHVSWEKDYFTTARPWPQKGPDVSLPLGTSAPVVRNSPSAGPQWKAANVDPAYLMAQSGSGNVGWNSAPTSTAAATWGADTGLKADLTNATAVNVNDVRRAFALQRYQEARARYGSRYTEYLRYLGVKSSDARLQRPEFLGGGKATISFSEVLKTGSVEDPSEPVGTMKGHGIAAVRSNRYRRFFEEHGIVLSLLSARPKTVYVEGMNRRLFRSVKEDFWQKELEQIGQQEVLAREVYGPGGTTVFGYQDRYAEYKREFSSVHGDFRSTLSHWHLGRSFSSAPVLNGAFVQCDPSDRIFADQTGSDHLWCMVYNSIQARRLVSSSGGSRIL